MPTVVDSVPLSGLPAVTLLNRSVDEFLVWQGNNKGKRALIDRLLGELGLWRVLAHGALPIAHTGASGEVYKIQHTIPGNAMGPNGSLRVTYTWDSTLNANLKTARVRFGGVGGVGGTLFQNIGMISPSQCARFQCQINNRSINSQVGFGAGGAGYGNSGNAPQTGIIDTSVDQGLAITAALAVTTDTMTFQSYLIEVLHRD